MTPPASKAHRTPPRSRPLLRVVENFQPAVEDHGPPPAPSPEPEVGSQRPALQLVEALDAAERRIDSVATRMGLAQADLRLVREVLAELDASRSVWTRFLRYGLAVVLLPALLALAWAGATALPSLTTIVVRPYPPLLAGIATLVGAVWAHVAGSQLLLSLCLPGGSLIVVFTAALFLRLKWRRGLAVSDR